jgi:hypothetical protein
MSDLFVVRIAGVFALLAVVAQFGAMGIAIANGIQPGAPLDFSDGAQLLAAADVSPGVLGLVLATLSPSLALPLGLGLYVVLKDAKGYALFGATMLYVGMTIALVHEVLRIVLFWRMPGLYQRATEAARPAVLALGDMVVHIQDMISLMAFVIIFGSGFTPLALAILRTGTLPRPLGWVLLFIGVGVGLVAYPLQYFRVAGASLVVLAGMLVFFVRLIAIGVMLLRWRPSVAPAALSVFLLAAPVAAQSVSQLDGKNVSIAQTNFKGRSAAQVIAAPDALNAASYAVVKSASFLNGTIEVDLAGQPAAGAGGGARGFIGIAFRLQSNGAYEYIYLRPTNGRADDQVRRNHSTQYSSHPDFDFARSRREAPEKYESYVDLEPGVWTKYRIEIDGRSARLYVHGSEQPCLIVNDMKLEPRSGGVALWVGPGTEGYFSNLKITAR